ncbi:MAG: hypothetical protein CM15mP74_16570 [Halieaceae bacterium]|nr:MAG: hypothetical protein CM15mP74_16570 [Halieaceae bacterium]
MTDAVTILAMHPEMHTLFPTPPKRWRWIEAGNDIEATIKNVAVTSRSCSRPVLKSSIKDALSVPKTEDDCLHFSGIQ